jgi:hypothetical protein
MIKQNPYPDPGHRATTDNPGHVLENDYDSAVRGCVGWCTSCSRFTTDGFPPTAEEQTRDPIKGCADCRGNYVVGAAYALKAGLILIWEYEVMSTRRPPDYQPRVTT